MSDASRPEINTHDYLTNQRKKLQMADRRPAGKRASDVVGPGMRQYARRVEDFSSPSATVNGYFSAQGALNGPLSTSGAPMDTSPYVFWVVSDRELGGVQRATNLTTGAEWKRRFLRNATDYDFITWAAWISV